MTSLPDVTVSEQDGGLGAGEQPSGKILGVIGNSSAGTALAPRKYTNKGKLIAAAGYGPGIEAACLDIDKGAEVWFCKVANTTAGAAGSVTTSAAGGLAAFSVTGTPFDTEEFIVTITRSGTVAVDPAPMFNYSRDGGNTDEGEVRLPANGTYAVPHSGISFVFAEVTHTFTAATTDICTATAHGMVALTPVTLTNSGGALPAGLAAATTYYVTTVTTDSFKLSSTADGLTIVDITSTGTGTHTLHVLASLVAGATYTFATTAPIWGANDVASAMDAMAATGEPFRMIHLVGTCSATRATAVAAKLDTMALDHQPTSALVEVKDFGADSEDTWAASITADFDAFVSTRVGVGAGHCRLTSAVSGRLYRRPFAWAVGARIGATEIHVDLGRVKDGPIKEIAKGVDGFSIYHDERNDEVLDSERFITSRTFVTKKGAFITNPNLMAAPGSDFRRWQNRFVMDQVYRTSYATLLDEISDSVRIDAATGFILEEDAQATEHTNDEALRNDLKAPGHVSAVRTIVSRDDDITATEKVTVEVKAIPLGYKKFISLSIDFAKTL